MFVLNEVSATDISGKIETQGLDYAYYGNMWSSNDYYDQEMSDILELLDGYFGRSRPMGSLQFKRGYRLKYWR